MFEFQYANKKRLPGLILFECWQWLFFVDACRAFSPPALLPK